MKNLILLSMLLIGAESASAQCADYVPSVAEQKYVLSQEVESREKAPVQAVVLLAGEKAVIRFGAKGRGVAKIVYRFHSPREECYPRFSQLTGAVPPQELIDNPLGLVVVSYQSEPAARQVTREIRLVLDVHAPGCSAKGPNGKPWTPTGKLRDTILIPRGTSFNDTCLTQLSSSK